MDFLLKTQAWSVRMWYYIKATIIESKLQEHRFRSIDTEWDAALSKGKRKRGTGSDIVTSAFYYQGLFCYATSSPRSSLPLVLAPPNEDVRERRGGDTFRSHLTACLLEVSLRDWTTQHDGGAGTVSGSRLMRGHKETQVSVIEMMEW